MLSGADVVSPAYVDKDDDGDDDVDVDVVDVDYVDDARMDIANVTSHNTRCTVSH